LKIFEELLRPSKGSFGASTSPLVMGMAGTNKRFTAEILYVFWREVSYVRITSSTVTLPAFQAIMASLISTSFFSSLSHQISLEMVALELSLEEFAGLLEHTRPMWGKRSTPEKRNKDRKNPNHNIGVIKCLQPCRTPLGNMKVFFNALVYRHFRFRNRILHI